MAEMPNDMKVRVERKISGLEALIVVTSLVIAVIAGIFSYAYVNEREVAIGLRAELKAANERIADISYDYGMCSGKRWLEEANAKAMMYEMDMGGGK